MRYLYHHLGLGDHIICNGMVREILKDGVYTALFVKKSYIDMIRFMYRDVPNCLLYKVDDTDDVQDVKKKIENIKEIILTGMFGKDWPGSESHFDEAFYRQANIQYNRRWDSFKIDRDINREMLLHNKLQLAGKRYIFIHDDSKRSYNINEKYLRKDLEVVRVNPSLTDNIFDYIYLMENAEEIHCMDGCFFCLTEHINNKGSLFFHRYAKGTNGWNVPFSRKDWKVYE